MTVASLGCRVAGLIVVGLGLAVPPSAGQHGPPVPTSQQLVRRVDAYVGPYVRMRDFSGTVLVARGGRVLVDRAYGLASYELGLPASPTMRFGIGSVTKTFTAAAI